MKTASNVILVVALAVIAACGSQQADDTNSAADNAGADEPIAAEPADCYYLDGSDACVATQAEACGECALDQCTCTEAQSRNRCGCAAAGATEECPYMGDDRECLATREDACTEIDCDLERCTCTEAGTRDSCTCRAE